MVRQPAAAAPTTARAIRGSGCRKGRSMTEEEWLTCDDPKPIFAFLRGITTDRKLRLYFCAGCRCIENFLVLNVSRKAVDVAEKVADGLTTTEEVRSAW